MTAPRLAFPQAEYDERLAAVRANMQAAGLDVLVTHVPANLCYLTGFSTLGIFEYAALIVHLDRPPTLILRALEEYLARSRVWIDDIVTFGDADEPVATLAARLKDTKARRIGVERRVPYLTPDRYEALRASLGDERITSGDGIVEKARLVKSPREIEYLRTAARYGDLSMRAGLAAIREGATENEVALALYDGGIRAGSDYPSLPPAVLAGARTGLPHSTWDGRVLARGDVVYLGTSAAVERYSTALFRTATIGPASSETAAYGAVVAAALEATKRAIRPGAVASDVDAACHGEFERAGLGPLHRHRAGFSMGISFPPHFGEVAVAALRPRNDLVLRPRMVFHLHPGLFIQGKIGIAITETVLVTDAGSEFLGTLPRQLVEISPDAARQPVRAASAPD